MLTMKFAHHVQEWFACVVWGYILKYQDTFCGKAGL